MEASGIQRFPDAIVTGGSPASAKVPLFWRAGGTIPPTSGGCAVLRGISRFGVDAAGEIDLINQSPEPS